MTTAVRSAVHLPQKYVKWNLYPHQWAFLGLSQHARESFIGGSVGGGKTVVLLAGCLQYVEVPRYHSLFLRRTIGELRAADGPIMLANEWLRGSDAVWNENDLRWTFPSGATLTFGFLRTQTDHLQYQGAQYQTIAFDELTHFNEEQYLWLFSRMRKARAMEAGELIDTPLDYVPIRMLTASNPGGPGHEWVKERFIPQWFLDALEQREQGKPLDLDNIEEGEPKFNDRGQPRVFVPSLMEQNTALVGDEYDDTLSNLSPVERAQFRYGDWNVDVEGTMFERGMFRFVDIAPVPTPKIRAWDLAAHDPKVTRDGAYTAGALVGMNRQNFYLYDVRRKRGLPGDMDKMIVQTALQDGPHIPIYIEEERGGAGKFVIQHYRTLLPGFNVYAAELTGSKEARARPVAGFAYDGRIHIVRWSDATPTWVEPFLQEVVAFPTGRFRDQVDAFVHGVSALQTHQWSGGGQVVVTANGRRRPRKAA